MGREGFGQLGQVLDFDLKHDLGTDGSTGLVDGRGNGSARMAQAGEIGLVGAYYELASGRVHFSEPVHPGVQARAGAAH